MIDQPWVEKYKPRHTKDLVGNKAVTSRVQDWLQRWPKSVLRNQRVLLLFGPAGVGKTLAVHTIANEVGYEIFEINASVKRSKKRMNELLKTSTMTKTLTSKRGRVILIDELEGLSGKSDRGATSAIKESIIETQVPIILITNDVTDAKISPLRKLCTYIEFQPITNAEIVEKLQSICDEEALKYDKTALEQLALGSRGDLRAAINDLQRLAESGSTITTERVANLLKARDRTIDINEALDRIFYAKTWNDAIYAANQTDTYPDELLRWVSNNMSIVFPSLAQQEKGLAILSKASIHNQRIKQTQNWSLLPYSKELMSLSASILGGTPAETHLEYRFPEWIRQMGFSRGHRQKRALIGQSLSPIVHLSSKKAYKEYKVILKVLIEAGGLKEEIKRDLELTDDLLQFLLKD